ncbi:hypothetical protein F2P81_017874 [Scophthalmus maximus]|uniref:Uncharacterized protein n=1 Tax=Scophthalmus maximus TaxID=52904 RepID=A0A6A4S895_SCOMX|nr:hypothetical protein F2P81_017874 [Scophthalmus maximus]
MLLFTLKRTVMTSLYDPLPRVHQLVPCCSAGELDPNITRLDSASPRLQALPPLPWQLSVLRRRLEAAKLSLDE